MTSWRRNPAESPHIQLPWCPDLGSRGSWMLSEGDRAQPLGPTWSGSQTSVCGRCQEGSPHEDREGGHPPREEPHQHQAAPERNFLQRFTATLSTVCSGRRSPRQVLYVKFNTVHSEPSSSTRAVTHALGPLVEPSYPTGSAGASANFCFGGEGQSKQPASLTAFHFVGKTILQKELLGLHFLP